MAFPINDFEIQACLLEPQKKARKSPFLPGDLLLFRDLFIRKLFIDPEPNDDQIALQISRLVQVTSRVASTESTAFDSNTASSSATSTSNTLTKQVERAFTQILSGAENFLTPHVEKTVTRENSMRVSICSRFLCEA